MSTPNANPPTAVRAARTTRWHLVHAAVAAFGLALGAQASGAQATTDSGSKFEFVVSSGSLIPVGEQHRAIKRGDVTAAQLSYAIRPFLAVNTTLGWARSRDIVATGDPKLDVFTYDVGAELRATRWVTGGAVTFTPFVGGGGGARSYNYRSLDADATHNLSAYASAGGELGYKRVRVRVEARDYVGGFKPLVAAGASGRRNDVIVMAGLRITKH